MSSSEITSMSLDERLATLDALVQEQRRRIELLEAEREEGPQRPNGQHSRRDVLRLAGAAVVGVAGGVALNALPAAAAQGAAVNAGVLNTADLTTSLVPTNATVALGSRGLFEADMRSGTTGNGVWGFASLGYAGVIGQASTDATNGGVGVQGYDPGGFGYGVLAGSLGGIDIGALGAGNIQQVALPAAALTASPAGPPNYAPANYEQVRDGNGVVWLSGTAGSWRRDNTVRVDNAAGTAAFTPARILDTRSATGPTAGQPLHGDGTTYTFGPFTGTNGIPADAIGIVGNLTMVGFSAAGYAALFPGGVAWPGNSSINFGPPFASSGWANAFTLGFGTGANAGKVSIRLSQNGITSHAILDVTAYLQ